MIKSKFGRVAAVLAALAIPAGGLTVLTSGVASAATTNTVTIAATTAIGAVNCTGTWATVQTPTSGACLSSHTTTGTPQVAPAAVSGFYKTVLRPFLLIPSPDILIYFQGVVICDVSLVGSIVLTTNGGGNYSATVTLTTTPSAATTTSSTGPLFVTAYGAGPGCSAASIASSPIALTVSVS